MGPYCKFCGRRCFVPMPMETPQAALDAWGEGSWILATCPGGQEFEAERRGGWNIDRVRAAINETYHPLSRESKEAA